MKKQQKYAVLVGALAVLFIAGASRPASAAMIIGPSLANGSFESNAKVSGTMNLLTATGLPDWTITSGNSTIYQFNNPTGYGTAFDGSQWLQLQGDSGAGTIQQTFQATLGDTYSLTFEYGMVGGNTGLHLTWSIGSVSSGSGGGTLTLDGTGSPVDWIGEEIYTYTPTASGIVTLSFTGDHGGTSFWGPSLDNVTLNEIVPVPEPATFALLLFGGGLMAWHRRNHR